MKAERNPNSKLNNLQVRIMRKTPEITNVYFARIWQVSVQTISFARTGVTFQDIKQ
jgi:DNA-binding transcriptional regulator YiaG